MRLSRSRVTRRFAWAMCAAGDSPAGTKTLATEADEFALRWCIGSSSGDVDGVHVPGTGRSSELELSGVRDAVEDLDDGERGAKSMRSLDAECWRALFATCAATAAVFVILGSVRSAAPLSDLEEVSALGGVVMVFFDSGLPSSPSVSELLSALLANHTDGFTIGPTLALSLILTA